MNERIRELANKAGIKIIPLVIDGVEYEYEDIDMDGSEDLEKFAELIVFECVKAVMDGTKEGDHYAQRIEQHFDNGTDGVLHFGVEE